MDRYIKNMNSITKEENKKLRDFKVCVVGCGGLGGYIIEMLARLGIGYISGVDNDVFDATNLNRQLISHTQNLGCKKALETRNRVKIINPEINFKPVIEKLTKDNATKIISGHDIVIDAVDNTSTRLLIQTTCLELNIPLIHGAVAGWYGQVSVIIPGDDTLTRIYQNQKEKGIETELGNPSFIPPLIASIEVSEAIKVLLNKGETLRNKLLYIDLLTNSYNVFEI